MSYFVDKCLCQSTRSKTCLIDIPRMANAHFADAIVREVRFVLCMSKVLCDEL